MTAKEVQLSITLPLGMHEQVRDLAQARGIEFGRVVTMGEVYSLAIGVLTARLDAGEDIVFACHPKGGVRRASIRGRYIERTQIYAKRRQVCLGVRKHPFVAHLRWR